MRGSFLIARIAGTGVYIHFTFPLLVAFYGYMFYQSALENPSAYPNGPDDAAIYGVTLILLLFLCVLLHEFGHAFAARAFGIRTPDITLLPFGGVARLERMPSSPWQELIIAVAGPAVNVVIAIVLGLVLFGAALPQGLFRLNEFHTSLGIDLLNMNIFLILFNLIPAFPMDGGRVLRAVLAMFTSHAKATMIAARIGQGIAVLFIVASFTPYGSTMLIFIAMFVFMGAQQELNYSKIRHAAQHGRRVGDIMITHFKTLRENMRAGEIRALLFQNAQDVFPVVDEQEHLRGLLLREDIQHAVEGLPTDEPFSCDIHTISSVSMDMEIDEAVRRLQDAPIPILAVENPIGQLVGLISRNQLISLKEMREEESL